MVETIVLISFKKRGCQGGKGTTGHAFANKTSWHPHFAPAASAAAILKASFQGLSALIATSL